MKPGQKRGALSCLLVSLAWPLAGRAQTPPPPDASISSPSNRVTELAPIIVNATAPAHPDTDRQQVDESLGTSTYTLNQQQIDTIAQGANTSFNQVLARTPGVSSDTYGAIHFRNEDPYYRYYINGTLLPSGINGFSQDIDTRFVESLTVKIGALSAMYPEGNYGIVDIQTKTGAELNGGNVSFYGGSFDTLHPTFSYGGTSKGTDFYFTGSYLHNDLGLENPTSSTAAIHDETNQYRGLAYISHQFEGSGRLSVVFSGADAAYQIPNTPGQVSNFDFSGTTTAPVAVDSTSLNERQNEQTYYGFIAYQQTIDDFSFQISQVNRSSTVKFDPDVNGDLYFNGVAAQVDQYVVTNGLQADFTYQAGASHTIRAGVLADTQGAGARDTSYVYPTDADGNPVGDPEAILDNHFKRAYDFAVYAQDEWKITDKLTINYGLRFEQVKAYTNESQFSPRINAVYQVDKATAVHAGYARYFDPPQLLNISSNSVSQFDNTTNAADQDTNDPVLAEKSHYFDAGITHKFLPELEVGVDTYYKLATDQIDDGQFGAANISSPYNYGTASMYGVDLSIDYTHEGFTAFGNFSASDSWAKNIVSSQFEFDADELAAIGQNNVRFDQQQFYTASAGISYTWLDTTIHVDALYGDGIRAGFVNQQKLEPYYPVNIGIGEGAVKYGNRRGFFGGVSYSF
jgi:outer membrane receptor protein involved in Fe transport